MKITDMNYYIIVRFDSIKIRDNFKYYDIELPYKSAFDLFNNPWGLDTLSINGFFSEGQKDGFSKVIRSLGFTVMNSHGVGINFKDLFNFRVIKISLHYIFRTIFKDH